MASSGLFPQPLWISVRREANPSILVNAPRRCQGPRPVPIPPVSSSSASDLELPRRYPPSGFDARRLHRDRFTQQPRRRIAGRHRNGGGGQQRLDPVRRDLGVRAGVRAAAMALRVAAPSDCRYRVSGVAGAALDSERDQTAGPRNGIGLCGCDVRRPLRRNVYEGFLTNALNPSIASFYLVRRSTVRAAGDAVRSSVLALTAIHVAIALTCHVVWALAGGTMADLPMAGRVGSSTPARARRCSPLR